MSSAPFPLATLSEIKKPVQYSLIGGPFGSKLGQKDYEPDGIPVIRGANLPADRRFSFEDFVFVTPAKVERDLRSNRAFPGDIVVTQRGTLGQVGLIPRDSPYDEFVLSQSQMKLTVDDARADADFVYYALKSPLGQHEIISRALTAGVPHINLAIFGEVTIPLPPLPIQRKIASVLSGYDDLVENNRRRIELLDDMARRMYREWFVELRFPGHGDVPIVESDLGPIPERWSWTPLFDAANVTFGFPFKSRLFNSLGDGIPVVRIRDLPRNFTETFTSEIPPVGYDIEDGDVLIGMDGDFHMCIWAAGAATLNQRVCRVRPKDGYLGRYGTFLALQKPISDWNSAIVGTTVAHLGKRHMDLIRLLVPAREIRDAFIEHVEPMLAEQIVARKAIRNLTDARDLLLPRLISGEVDIKDLDIFVVEAAA
jgi:type I restriction enzyme, S subunit